MRVFLQQHPTIKIEVTEVALNGGWELLENNYIDLAIGCPRPVPQQKGYGAGALADFKPTATIACNYPPAVAKDQNAINNLRKIIIHDTCVDAIAGSSGFDYQDEVFYVQNIDQKVTAIRAAIGIGNIPQHQVPSLTNSGELIVVNAVDAASDQHYIAWKISSKNRRLMGLRDALIQSTLSGLSDTPKKAWQRRILVIIYNSDYSHHHFF